MKRKRCTEEKIISVLKGHEAGASAAELAYPKIRSTVGSRSLAGWRSRKPNGCATSSRRMLD